MATVFRKGKKPITIVLTEDIINYLDEVGGKVSMSRASYITQLLMQDKRNREMMATFGDLPQMLDELREMARSMQQNKPSTITTDVLTSG